MFICWIISSILFLALSYLFKYKSIWQEAFSKAKKNIWAMKDVDDYLNHLKFEYKLFCVSFSMIVNDLIMYDYSMQY